MIRSVNGRLTERLAAGERPKKFPAALIERARSKLAMIDAAEALSDLASPPGNRLHVLSGDRTGFHAVRINDHWRIVFRWSNGGADDVEVTDYH